IGILTLFKEQLGLRSPLPSDFEALPIMNPLHSWFFPFEYERKAGTIDSLWEFAKAIVKDRPESIPPALFDRCLNIKSVAVPSLTMGMFWMRPDAYVGLDARNSVYLSAKGFDVKGVHDWTSYLALRGKIQEQFPGVTWPELSAKAYQASIITTRYWLFQAD